MLLPPMAAPHQWRAHVSQCVSNLLR
jgi:hypothetical protein